MLKICPQCSAEVLAHAEECFACGIIFSEWGESKQVEKRQSSPFGRKKEGHHPQGLLLGDLIEDRFTVQRKIEYPGLWVLYRVVDQQDGHTRTMQMGSQAHRSVQDVISSIAVLGEEYFIPTVLEVGSNPASFFIFDDWEGITLLDWKNESPSMKQRRDFCSQMLFVFVQLSRRDVSLGKWDMNKIFVHDRGYIWIHPSLLKGGRIQDNTKLLEWMYWMLSDRIQSLQHQRFPLSGLSLRDAHWIRMMVRRRPSIYQLSNAWDQAEEIDYGMDAARARQLYERFTQEFVFCEHGKGISFGLTYACDKKLVYGTEFCHEGLIVGYVDRVLLAWEGLYFDGDIPELSAMYQRLVLDEDVPLFHDETMDFERLLIQLKIQYLLRLDWERTLVQVLARAQTFDEWMDINRFRILFGVQKDKVMVPKPQSVHEHLALSSFFYWFANDEDEAMMWFEEAVQLAQDDAFDFILVLEAHCAMFGVPSSESFAELRNMGLSYTLEHQLLLLEKLEDRLGIMDEEWLKQVQFESTQERVLWCSSRYASQEEIDALDQYAQTLVKQLETFSIVYEVVQWRDIEKYEEVLASQIHWLAQIHQRNKLYEQEGLSVPVLNPPFSDEKNVDHKEKLERLLERRRQEQAEKRRKEDARLDRQDGYAVLIMILLALVMIWLLF